MSTPAPSGLAEKILNSPPFEHLVQGFEFASGLRLHAYSLDAVPLTVPVDPPPFCQALQSTMDCPLFFEPRYHRARLPELRATCGGLGHVVVPVLDADGNQLANLVSDPARFGPVDMDAIARLSYKLRVFPDELAAHAETVPLVEPERVMLSARALFDAVRELATGEVPGARVLSRVTRLLARAEPEEVPMVLAQAALEFAGAEFAYVRMLDDAGIMIAEESTLTARAEWWKVLQGTAEWVVHAGKAVDIPDVSESAWCRHLAGMVPPPAAMVGMPLMKAEVAFGALVVGGADRARLAEWGAALGILTTSSTDAILLARRLLQSGGAMVDPASGAYSLRFLEELLEKEISRAGRHQHDLSVVLFHIANLDELISRLGSQAAELALAQLTEVLRGKTRKVNSLARINGSDFALVIPEAGPEIAERIAGELTAAAGQAAITTGVDGHAGSVRFNLQSRTVSNPSQVRSVLEEYVSSPN
ncbi:MAG: diguanylate cyclase [Candidatus Dormibacteraeota bacterium]|nr:diguanylate cyclase [Candidatus Dormibacteraeota bacterium]